ncbi:uncharacterized protein [Periplaneta americana]|uniref:uncharacterized protein n=1 Tax=Periplaneta americana TaxID=6978 RepID=UPI0037E9C6AE
MEWSEEEMLGLVEEYKLCPVLWNPSDKDYYKKHKKIDAWRDISTNIGRPEEDCKKKIISLLSSYRREKSRVKKSNRTRKGYSEVYCSRWFAYAAFRFLEDRDKPRQRVDTETDVTNEENTTQQNVPVTQDEAGDRSEGGRAPKRAKKQVDDTELLANAVGILQATAGRLNSTVEQCEVQSFCAFLSSKMMTYRATTRQGVQHAIYDILVKADRGLFEVPVPTYCGQERVPLFDKSSSQMGHSRQPTQLITPSTSYASAPEPPKRLPTQQPSEIDLSISQSPNPLLPSLHPDTSGSEPRSLGSVQHQSAHTPSPECSPQYSDDLNEYV